MIHTAEQRQPTSYMDFPRISQGQASGGSSRTVNLDRSHHVTDRYMDFEGHLRVNRHATLDWGSR